jgi:hypothetical protein
MVQVLRRKKAVMRFLFDLWMFQGAFRPWKSHVWVVVISAGSLEMSYWKLQQSALHVGAVNVNFKGITTGCTLNTLGTTCTDTTATSTCILRPPIATISYSKNITVV